MLERWIIISGAALGPVLYSVFVAITYSMTIQLRKIIFIIIIRPMLLPFATTY